MVEAIAFDTHRLVKRLQEGGFTEVQAETLAEDRVDLLSSELATKVDVRRIEAEIDAFRQETKVEIEKLRQETKAEIEKLRQETKVEIEKLRQETKANLEGVKVDLLKWVIPLLLAQGTLIVAMIKLIPG